MTEKNEPVKTEAQAGDKKEQPKHQPGGFNTPFDALKGFKAAKGG